uniref:Putative ovule protein n=1 Tax=Solanum chacoense TaxID=4108 RepID=A0A0V0HMN4_SOLCH
MKLRTSFYQCKHLSGILKVWKQPIYLLGKVYVHSTLPRLHLWDLTGYVVINTCQEYHLVSTPPKKKK